MAKTTPVHDTIEHATKCKATFKNDYHMYVSYCESLYSPTVHLVPVHRAIYASIKVKG